MLYGLSFPSFVPLYPCSLASFNLGAYSPCLTSLAGRGTLRLKLICFTLNPPPRPLLVRSTLLAGRVPGLPTPLAGGVDKAEGG